ncbi:hypothetical protein [Actinospica sp.]|uniref:hypothetical protein n=1 Tax=Actinospica sp. TaxID=1872142 RepID=UPI002BB715CD|nr:hypothetical protein [Actinospica sp.]HWG26484.1 hypothetical protein [Actinospica sp.]
MIGLLAGLADAGQDVTAVDTIVGTSAGSTVAAQLGSGLRLEGVYVRQTEPELQAAEIMADVDLESFGAQIADQLRGATSVTEMRQAVGRFALDAATVSEPERRAVIESRLPSHAWPAPLALKIVALNAESGQSSRSWIKNRARTPASSRSINRLRACCAGALNAAAPWTTEKPQRSTLCLHLSRRWPEARRALRTRTPVPSRPRSRPS